MREEGEEAHVVSTSLILASVGAFKRDGSFRLLMHSRGEALMHLMQAKERGNAAFKKGKLDAAVDCYTEAIAFDPDVSIYYTNRAFCLFKKVTLDANSLASCKHYLCVQAGDITSENTERIEADSRKSLELDPRNAKGKPSHSSPYS